MLMTLVALPVLASCGVKISKADMTAYEGFNENNHFKTSKYSDVLDMIDNKEDGIYLFASPENPTSLSFVENLEEIAKEKEIDIIYVDISSKSYSSNIDERVSKLSNSYIDDANHRNVYPIVYVVKKGNINTVSPVFEGVSVSSRLLNFDEQESVKDSIERLWFD